MATLPSEARLALWLLEAAPGNGEAALPTHQALAELLGVTRVTVSRALGRLRAQGLISTGRHRAKLLAPELLALRASGASPGTAVGVAPGAAPGTAPGAAPPPL
ncbi:helix-turn-helix domain-containing protein [Streptomyces albiaxialis]|uniref:Crp/Fnr family transcriptional regulator n=1 Tax=Streptomyces albiaxialis TaxID=329523 RepID=UPI0031D37815